MVTTVVEPNAVLLGDAVVQGARVRVREGTIVEVGNFECSDPVQRVDGTLLPGMVDLQCNGAGGHSVDEATPAALDAIAEQVSRGGAAAFLPTLITAPFDLLLQRLAAVAGWIEAGPERGARPVGIHLEGPFLQAPGTHEASHFVDPTDDRIEALLAAAAGHLALVTLAPGRSGAAEATARLRQAGVAVALGHATSAEGFDRCVDAGASLVTHLFNAMGPLHHREPGLAGRALDEQRLCCSLIADGVHVHEVMVRNAWRCLGPERTVLVTDSVSAAGMPDGEYALSGRRVVLADGVVRDDDGHLAGSALTMGEAAQTWMRMVGDPGPHALAQVTAANPARLLGRAGLGAIEPGRDALFTLFDPQGKLRCWRPA